MLTVLAGCGSVSAANSAGGSGLSGSTDAAELETPTPGINTFLGTTNVAFTWTTGSGATAYELTLGTTGPGSSDIADSGSITGTSTTVNSIPANGMTVYATLNSRIGGKWKSIGYTYSESKPVSVKALSCTSKSILGSGTDTCTVELSAAATGAQNVSLSSNSSSVKVPSSVTVASGATSASFQAVVLAVGAAQTATLTASLGGATESYAINLEASAAYLTLSTTSVNFGTVNVASTASQLVTLTSSGTEAVTVSAGSVSGSGFSASGVSFPLTLNPGQTATLTIGFDPTKAGAASGAVTLSSNSATSTIALSGTGQPVLSGLSCASGSETGAAADVCTVTLNAAAPTGGEAVTLVSNNTAVTVPPSVTVAAGAVSASFQVEVSSVSTAQTATVKATLASTTASYAINLGDTVPTLKLSVTSLNFGTVNVASTTSQPVILTSSGTGAVTVSAGSVSGAGFTLSGVSFPLTLNSGQTATLTIGFDPTTAGAASGAVTLTSNSSTGTTSTIALSGTGQSVPYQVNITWDAPASSTDPVAGYNIYRTTSGGSSYSLLNSSVNSSTSYIDTTVADGNSYTYYIESVDAEGNQSSPSNTFTVSIP